MLTSAAITIAKKRSFNSDDQAVNSFQLLSSLHLPYTLMSKSFREGFVCWLYGFYSAGKYIHLIALWMVRIWINETDCSMNRGINEDQFPVGLWPMFLHFLPFCCPLFSTLPITSPCCIPLSSSVFHLLLSLLPCVSQHRHTAAQSSAGLQPHAFLAQPEQAPASAPSLAQAQEPWGGFRCLKAC